MDTKVIDEARRLLRALCPVDGTFDEVGANIYRALEETVRKSLKNLFNGSSVDKYITTFDYLNGLCFSSSLSPFLGHFVRNELERLVLMAETINECCQKKLPTSLFRMVIESTKKGRGWHENCLTRIETPCIEHDAGPCIASVKSKEGVAVGFAHNGVRILECFNLERGEFSPWASPYVKKHLWRTAREMGLTLEEGWELSVDEQLRSVSPELVDRYSILVDMQADDVWASHRGRGGSVPTLGEILGRTFFGDLDSGLSAESPPEQVIEALKGIRRKARPYFLTYGARKPPRQQIITVRPSHRPTRQRAPRSHHRSAVSTRGGDSGDDESGESDPPAPPLSWRSCPYHRLPSHNPQLLEPLQLFPCGDVSRGRYRRRSLVVDSGRCAA